MDFGNDFLNKDKVLYTLVLSKVGAQVVLSVLDSLSRGATMDRLVTKPSVYALIGAAEGGMVALNRVVMDSNKDSQGKTSTGIKVAFGVGAIAPFSVVDVSIHTKLSGYGSVLPTFITNNPILTSLPPSTFLDEESAILSGMKKVVNIGGSIAVCMGILLSL